WATVPLFFALNVTLPEAAEALSTVIANSESVALIVAPALPAPAVGDEDELVSLSSLLPQAAMSANAPTSNPSSSPHRSTVRMGYLFSLVGQVLTSMLLVQA